MIVVSSVSCIYGLGSPEDYRAMLTPISVGQQLTREAFLSKLVDMLYERNDISFTRGKFRVRGDVIEVCSANEDEIGIRVEFFGDEIDRISLFDSLTGKVDKTVPGLTIFPAKQFVTPHEKLRRAQATIRTELDARIAEFETQGKLLEAQRLKMRTEYDLEMLQEMGFCSGIENYTRHLSGRPANSTPYTLLDFFPTISCSSWTRATPRSRRSAVCTRATARARACWSITVSRLPSAMDNRPLKFPEFMGHQRQIIYISATPAQFEINNSTVGNKTYVPHPREAANNIGEGETTPVRLAGMRAAEAAGTYLAPARDQAPAVPRPNLKIIRRHASPVVEAADADKKPNGNGHDYKDRHATSDIADSFDVFVDGQPLIVEQIIRPTGLLDPQITVKPLKNQIDDTIEACRQRIEAGERVLITTLTKRTAEDLTDYMRDVGLKVRYLHSDIDTIERVEILRALRAAEFDILIGINLLREGLDLPEVSLVCILDADKEGYLRSQTSLIQTAGRAARHVNGHVILFADTITMSMKKLLDVTEYRRARQIEIQRGERRDPDECPARGAGEFAHDAQGEGGRIRRDPRERRGFQHQRGVARVGSRDGRRRREPGIRTRRVVARSDHGTQERHGHLEDRTEETPGEGQLFQGQPQRRALRHPGGAARAEIPASGELICRATGPVAALWRATYPLHPFLRLLEP